MIWLLAILAISCALAITTLFLANHGAWHWAQSADLLTRKLDATGRGTDERRDSPLRFDSHELEGLPDAVKRYFHAALTEGQAIVTAATIEMSGNLNLAAEGDRWKSFRSWQRAITSRAGFLWNARVSMFPGLAVHVIDSYVAGTGHMHASILGLFTVARVEGEGEIARGELMRFFAEAPWYPTALLPSQGVRWAAVDANSANAKLVDGALTLTLLFRFNETGLIDSVRAEARGAMVKNTVVMLPWECRFAGYEVRNGMTIPMTGEAAWMRSTGRAPYFRGSVTKIEYKFAET